MPNNSPTSPSGTPAWWSRDEISIAETFSGGRPSSVSALSDGAINSSTPRRSINWAGASGSSTPDIKHKLQYASPATARQAALRMYETLKRHGLRNEAGKALTGGGGGGGNLETEETEQGKVRRSEELVGMEYLMKDGFADYLQKMARILPPIPQQIVRFSGIKYSKKIETSSNDYETFGNKLAGCIVGPLRKLYRKKNTMSLDILKGVDGYIMPGSVTLVLGPPGTIKSSTAVFKLHFHQYPFLSVRETLEFARDCTQGLRPENLTPQLRKFFAHALVEGQDPFIEHILEILNLKKVENQLAGVAISSSDHQNLTMAELLVGTYAMMIYDQPLSGCDLAATYDLVGTIKTISRIQQSSAVMSLTQLSEEVFNLFDRIIVLGDGQVVFQGLRQDAIPYFSNLGYKKPSFLESAEFLLQAMVYTLCMYFFAGLSLTGAAFFEFLLLLIFVAYFGSSVFFFLSAASPILEAGNALAGLLVSIFLLFSGFVIYPSNIPAYFKWMMYANPIHWANISFCQTQFENYIASCSDFIGKLPFCNQFPGITVGKAYLEFYELSRGAMRSWLPYIIIVGWIVVANMLALFGLKKLEFTGTIQSVPHIKRTHKRRNFITDVENEFRSASSYSERPDQSSEFKGTILQMLKTAARKIRDDRGDIWIDEFRIDIEKSELEIHFEPAVLLFEDLSFTRYNMASKESVSVFNNISGYIKPQYMLAILGGSQMCRSTLLRCLAARTPSNGNLKGHVQINTGKPGKSLNQLVGYVEKLDAHQPYLSVLESLQFSCALRLGKDIDARRRNMYVEMVLEELGLLPYSNQLVSSLRDSTGRTFEIAKKLTIGVELVANPSILFLEEPIFDLDITATQNILTILARLSESDHTIIATLTHPNMRSLSYFDHALILTREGEQAFFGPIGADCRNLTSYFSEVPKIPKYHLKHTPISFVMDLLGQGIKHKKVTSVNFAEIYGASTLHDDTTHEINRLKECSTKRDQKHTYPASYLQQANLVMLRTQKFLWRNVQYAYSRLIACIMIGFLMGSLYFQIEYKDTYGVTSRSLYIYMQVMLIGVVSANNIIPQIGSDRLVYFREWRAHMYHPIFYPLSWAICEIPYFLIATLVLVGIGNSMAGIGTGSATDFITYWIVLLLFTLCVTYFGMMVTFLASLPTFAAFLVSIITSLWVSAAGVVVLLSEIKFYRWMYWSNPFQYAINALTSIGFYLSFMSLLFVCLSFLFFVSLKHNRNPQS